MMQLCFPVIVHKHWFVFIVDLKNKLFVFLDSYFHGGDHFQIQAGTKLVSSYFFIVHFLKLNQSPFLFSSKFSLHFF